MEDYTKTASLKFRRQLNTKEVSLLKSKLEDAEDVDSVDISSEAVCIEYNALILAQEGVTELIREYGFPLSTYRKKQGVLTRFIENLARSNNNSYGSKKLDCCDLKH